jgi:hypothetical protein
VLTATRQILPVLIILTGAFHFSDTSASAKDEFDGAPDMNIENRISKPTNSSGYITSEQLLDSGSMSGPISTMGADQAVRYGGVDRAIAGLELYLAKNPKNMDARVQYAEALEKKLRAQKKRDPKLYNQALKQWLYISRNADYDDEKSKGKRHLKGLCGKTCMPYQTARWFLDGVVVPENNLSIVKIADEDDKQSKEF